MFSNTLKYALEQTVCEFNYFIQNSNNIKYSDIDYKNAFYQRFRKNIYRTEYKNLFNYNFNINNIKFLIEDGCLSCLKFETYNTYTEKLNNCISNLNRELNSIDLNELKENLNTYNLVDTFESSIQKISNFKVK